jgi:hemoglobin-like flavoprotein
MIISKGPYKICTDIGSKLFYSHMFNKLPRLESSSNESNDEQQDW